MIATSVMSLVLLVTSGVMIDSTLRNTRRRMDVDGLADRDRNYFRRQFRRRMQANVMIGVVGALVAVYPVVPQRPTWMAAYMAMLLIGVAWMVAMAMLDALAINRRYRRDRLEQIAEQARFALEAQRKKLAAQREAADDCE